MEYLYWDDENVQEFDNSDECTIFWTYQNQTHIFLKDCATWYVNYISINLKKWFIIVYRHHTKNIIRYMLLNLQYIK